VREKRHKLHVDSIFHKGARLARTEPTYEVALLKINFPMNAVEKRRFHRGYAQGAVVQRLQDLLSLANDLRIDQLETLKPELDELYAHYGGVDRVDDEDEESVEES
jgi:hypothetical protein